METGDSRWQPTYFGIISIFVAVNNLWLWLFAGCADCEAPLDFLRTGTASGSLIGGGIVSFVEAFRIMFILPADYLRLKLIKPLKEQYRKEGAARGEAHGKAQGIAEGEARGKAQGIAEGEARGEARMRTQFVEWLIRKADAERLGIPFDEPMPGADSGVNGHSPQG